MKKASAGNVIKFLIQVFSYIWLTRSDSFRQWQAICECDYNITHMRTAIYSPQSNVSERVNQQVLSTIRAYLEKDQRDWDKFLSEIECALRSSTHTVTGMSPYFVLFRQNMFTNGKDYKLARQLKALEDPELQIIRSDKLKDNLQRAYEVSAKCYNIRARELQFKPGQDVYKRNFVISNFKNNIKFKVL